MRFLYWATAENKERINFISEDFFEEGTVIDYKGMKVTIDDLAVEEDISCEELSMQMEDMRYYV